MGGRLFSGVDVAALRVAPRGGSPMVPQLVADSWTRGSGGCGDDHDPVERRNDLVGPGPVAGQPEPRSAATAASCSQAWLMVYSRDGNRPRPVSLAALIRSSTRAWARCRASKNASCPTRVLVAKAW